MQGLCGWLDYARESNNLTTLAKGVADALSAGRRYETATGYHSAIIAINPVHCQIKKQDQRVIGLCGRPHWRITHYQELARQSGLLSSIQTAFQEKGPAMLTALSGSFSLAIIDEDKKEALLAIDRAGIYPMVYALDGHRFQFGSTSDGIIAHPDSSPLIDPQAIFNYLYFHIVPGTTNIYKNHHRLAPGEYALFRNSEIKIGEYWQMAFSENRKSSFDSQSRNFHSLLRTCIKDAADNEKTGAFLSGGTDSSTVSGILNEVSENQADTYSIGFDAEGYDETEYARLASRHFSTNHHEYRVTPDDVVNAIPMIASAYDQPYGNASAIPTYYCAKLAADDGIEQLLGGDGGDELFGGNTRYAKQYTFAHYKRLPKFLRAKVIEPMLFNMPGTEKLPLTRKICSYIRQANIPMPMRMESYNLLNRLGVNNIFTKDFFNCVDQGYPEQFLHTLYDQVKSDTLINSMLALDMRLTLADNDLPKVREMCAQAGVGAAFPLLDDRMIEFSSQLPEKYKLNGGQLRYFFKKSLADFLPREIIHKKKHGFGLPFGIWLESHQGLRSLGMDSLHDLKERNIINPEFIESLTGDYLSQHAAYYGSMIWVMMMLEQWFKAHNPGYTL